MAAKNQVESLNKAIQRPGRFDKIIKMSDPDKKGRVDTLNYYLDKVK